MMNHKRELLPKKLRTLRAKMAYGGLTQKRIAELLGKDRSLVSHCLSNRGSAKETMKEIEKIIRNFTTTE